MIGHNIAIRWVTKLKLHYTALQCSTLDCIELYITLHCTTVHYITLIILRDTKLHCMTLQYIAIQFITLQCVALYCVALPCTTLHFIAWHYNILHCIHAYVHTYSYLCKNMYISDNMTLHQIRCYSTLYA